MAKGSKKRKQQSENSPVASKKLKQDAVQSLGNDSPLIGDLIFHDELETTTDTLITLARNPSLIGIKALKPFKTAVHDYWRVAHETSNTGNSLTSRISSALVDQRHVDALVLLSEMAIREHIPKLGALQRWVRECDAVLTPSMSQQDENRVWQVLDAILRTTQPELISSEVGGTLTPGTRLRWYQPFTVQPSSPGQEKLALDSAVIAERAVASMKELQVTAGPDRRPPNKHPAIIYYSPPNTFPLASAEDRTRQPERHDLPGVPGAFIINDVFETAECESLVKAAEKVGLLPDEPIAGSATQLSSVLAHNFIWLADAEFISTLYSRIVDLLPQTVHGGAVRSINRRFRLYRYRPGALYRPHIDGAWPASALNETTTPPSYTYDSDPTVYSRLTLLIYLNEDFEGGCTTYFLPSSTQGVLEARPIKPRTGTVAVFPHGAARGSLLHEGSGVKVGAKYVIRTEILYEVDKSERVDAIKD
ncbi:hypothetical protein Hypma_002847 [Hypsizygus marmoreus]|uniref:Fe2OG dioxygenase domain-containing protein n=1 Tax=Hypsizygus marmoreus TaxID=39966 RepID=A0A369J5F4_HYPMA|nr:hypothetical protein Hypma_002847 [Hypsizygus marmoreus]